MPPSGQREIRDYVRSQRTAFDMANEDAEVVQRVARRRNNGTTYEIFDVHMSGGSRWWVITNHTNLYPQAEFRSIDDALTHHIGLMSVSTEQFRHDFYGEDDSLPLRAYRRYSGAVATLAEAEEPEDFQAVGIKCRDALIALGAAYVDEYWVTIPEDVDRPRGADAKGWLRIYADSLCTSKRQRDYVRRLSEGTWDIAVALQHDSNATEWDAEIVLAATQTVFRTLAILLAKDRSTPAAGKCPQCDSYRLTWDSDEEMTMEGGQVGFFTWSICESCGWQSEREWDDWDAERLQRAAAYIAGEWSPPKRSMDVLDPGDVAVDQDKEENGQDERRSEPS